MDENLYLMFLGELYRDNRLLRIQLERLTNERKEASSKGSEEGSEVGSEGGAESISDPGNVGPSVAAAPTPEPLRPIAKRSRRGSV